MIIMQCPRENRKREMTRSMIFEVGGIRRRPPDTSASGIKYSGSWDIVAPRRKLELFSSETSYRKVSAALNESSPLGLGKRFAFLISFSRSRARDNIVGPRLGSVATPRLDIEVNAVYTGNYTLHPSFTCEVKRWKRKFDPKEKTLKE